MGYNDGMKRWKKQVKTDPVPNDPYQSAGMDSRNGDIKVMDAYGNVKYTVANRGQYQQGRKEYVKRSKRT